MALRAGLVGAGMMGRNHARVLRSLEGVELVAIADPIGDPHSVAGDLPLCGSVEELLAVGVDYCVVAVPTSLHEPVGLELAAAGVHALIEKPLGHDVISARRLAEAFEQAGLVGAVGHIERYNPAIQSLRERLDRGVLGEVYQIFTRRQGPFPARIADVGVVRDLATHDIDLSAWITQSHYVSVSAQTASKSGREHEDLVAMTGRLADGAVTNHLVNWLSPLKERVTIVTGEHGVLVADTLTADVTYYANGTMPMAWEAIASFRGVSEGDVIRYAIPKPEPLRTEHEAFRDALSGGAADIVTMRQGLQTVAVAEAVLESARTGTTQEIEPV